MAFPSEKVVPITGDGAIVQKNKIKQGNYPSSVFFSFFPNNKVISALIWKSEKVKNGKKKKVKMEGSKFKKQEKLTFAKSVYLSVCACQTIPEPQNQTVVK